MYYSLSFFFQYVEAKPTLSNLLLLAQALEHPVVFPFIFSHRAGITFLSFHGHNHQHNPLHHFSIQSLEEVLKSQQTSSGAMECIQSYKLQKLRLKSL